MIGRQPDDWSEAEYEEWMEDQRRHEDWERKSTKLHNKTIKRLKVKMKPVDFEPIDWLLSDHMTGYASIVKSDELVGSKVKAVDFFGQSSKLRHIWDNTSSCSYSGTYGGEVCVPLGKGNYLKIHIWS